MYRREPPPLAVWMLEHLASGERDEALTGDLHEHFRAGRSAGWYWRQVLIACLSSWMASLAARGPVFLFALLWSALAPAWQTIIEKIELPSSLDRGWTMLGPFMLLLLLAGWTAVHAVFVWIGLLVYQLAFTAAKKPLRAQDMWRAYWLSAVVLPPVAGIVFIFGIVYQYSLPGLAHARLANSALGQVIDLGILANLIRLPYFIALLVALWGTIAPSAREQRRREADSLLDGSAGSSGAIALAALDRPALLRFFAFMVAAGLVNSMIAAFLLCMLPATTHFSAAPLFVRALGYVVVTVLAGVFGAGAYWQSPWSPFRDRSPMPFTFFALVCASGWVWVPSMVAFSGAFSPSVVCVAMIGAFTLVTGLRHATYRVLAPVASGASSIAQPSAALFEETLYQPPADFTSYVITVLLVLAGAAFAVRSYNEAALLAAASVSLFAWKRAVPRGDSAEVQQQYKKAALQLALVFLPAVVAMAWALLATASMRNREQLAGLAAGTSPIAANQQQKTKSKVLSYGPGGFVSVILWPYPPKQKIAAPVMVESSALAPGSHQPLIVSFDGTYTFVQPPNVVPGPDAHKAQGTPLDFDIKSLTVSAVLMTAHQNLFRSIRVARCREIDVGIENFDNRSGMFFVALSLTGKTPGKAISLGEQPVVSSQPENFSQKTGPVFETLRFPVPSGSTLRDFSQITLTVLPELEHRYVAPKIAIRDLELFPR